MSDLSPEAQNLWKRAKKGGFEPSDAEVERVRQAVLSRIAAAPSSPSGSFPKWAKIGGLCVVLGAAVTVGVKLMPRSAPAPVVAAPQPQPEVIAAPPAIDPVPQAPLATEGEAVTPGRGTPAQERAGKEPVRSAPAARSATAEATADTLPEQVRIITEARAALGRQAFGQALARANEYETRFPKGVFVEEELAIRVLSLCGLGREKEAVRARETLERAVPNSRQLDRVRSSCAGAVKGFVP
jgi:RNA polymerase sigma-70 factor (ECF subfamily)